MLCWVDVDAVYRVEGVWRCGYNPVSLDFRTSTKESTITTAVLAQTCCEKKNLGKQIRIKLRYCSAVCLELPKTNEGVTIEFGHRHHKRAKLPIF